MDRKICWVADHLHGMIALSRLEKRLVSTAEYNRLHNILQNSTVYLTYPSNRTSRFAHSLGCAHIAGSVFRNAITNATDQCLKQFWRQFRSEVSALSEVEEFKSDLSRRDISMSAKEVRRHKLDGEFTDPFYFSEMPSRLTQMSDKYAFVLLFQAVRFAGLLHDVGHPPFSHITEYALGSIYEFLEDSQQSGHTTPRQRDLLRKLSAIRKPHNNNGTSGGNDKAFHEVLGLNLSAHMLESVLGSTLHSQSDRATYAAICLKHIALSILRDSNPFYSSLHAIVAGDIDADRIDYVPRDSIMSGFSFGAIELTRLLKSFQLVWHGHHTQSGKAHKATESIHEFEFMPSARAAGVLEDLFKRRYNLYKQVIYHHRVIKLDAMMQDCISELAKERLANGHKANNRDADAQFVLPQDISGLWQVLESDVATVSSDRVNCYIQWDDAWLLSALRRKYMELQAGPKEGRRSALFARLDELLSNRKHYFSLFKRADGFMEIDDVFIESFPKTFSWDDFESVLPQAAQIEAQRVKQQISHAKTSREMASRHSGVTPALADVQNEPVNKYGFALVSLLRALSLAGTWGKHGLDFVKDALAELKRTQNLTDTLLIRKGIKVGLKDTQHLVSGNGKVISLNHVSTLVSELEEAAHFFPPFFVFIFDNARAIDEQRLQECRRHFGKLLGERLSQMVKDRQKEHDPQTSFHGPEFWGETSKSRAAAQ